MKLSNVLFSLTLMTLLLVVTVDYIYLQHKSRNEFVQLQTLLDEERNLNAEWGKLQIEHSTLVSNNRIETEASKQLGMKIPERTHILNLKR